MSRRMLIFLTVLMITAVFLLTSCYQRDPEDEVREKYYEALKTRDVQAALLYFDELYSHHVVSDEEIFEASWLAYFCDSKGDLAWVYFNDIEDPSSVFDNIYRNISVLHLGARLSCSQGGEKECIDFSKKALSYTLQYENVQNTYLMDYVEEFEFLIESAGGLSIADDFIHNPCVDSKILE